MVGVLGESKGSAAPIPLGSPSGTVVTIASTFAAYPHFSQST